MSGISKRLAAARVHNESERDVQQEREPAEAQYYDHNGIEILDGTLWISDEIWFNIYSFMYNRSFNVDETATSYSDAGITRLFRNLVYVSPDVYHSLLRYVRHAPLKVYGDLYFSTIVTAAFERIAWLCKHKVKLGEYKIGSYGTNAFTFVKYILMSCDITQLEACHLDLRDWYGAVAGSLAVRAGIPSHVVQEYYNVMTTAEFQRFFVEYVPARAISLKRMKINVKIAGLHLPLLMNLSDSLEELELCIFAVEDCTCEDLSRAIGQLSKLKKLKVYALFKGSFRIYSSSLEEIDVIDCWNGFFIDKCVCPSLKMFKCAHTHKVNGNTLSNGIRPVVPFSKEERKDMEAKKVVTMAAGSRTFIGMTVPETCIVRIKCELSVRPRKLVDFTATMERA